MNDVTDEEDSAYNTIKVWGVDFAKSPCLKKSILYSVSGGVGVGLCTFLFTSRSKLACNVGFGSYAFGLFTYYIYCSYTTSMTRFQSGKFSEAMEKRLALGDFNKYENLTKKGDDV